MSKGIQHILTHSPKSSLAGKVNMRDDQLFFAVREPFQSQRTKIDLVGGYLGGRDALIVESYMPNNGVIFSDGIESDFLSFNSGNIATIGIAPETATLVQKSKKGNAIHPTTQNQKPNRRRGTKNSAESPNQTIDVGLWYHGDDR